MHLFDVTGDLMSLGAIDFGFLVDGPIVILEAVIAATAGRRLIGAARGAALRRDRRRRGAPGRVRGRDHHARLHAAARARRRRGQDVPADGDHHGVRAVRRAGVRRAVLPRGVGGDGAARQGPRSGAGSSALGTRYQRPAARASCAIAGCSCWRRSAFSGCRRGSSARRARSSCRASSRATRWSPSAARPASRSTKRASSISRPRRCCTRFPEVVTTLGMTGRAEVAIDPVGNDNTDMFVRLRPLAEWKTAHDFDSLSERFKTRIENESRAPSSRCRSRSKTAPTS